MPFLPCLHGFVSQLPQVCSSVTPRGPSCPPVKVPRQGSSQHGKVEAVLASSHDHSKLHLNYRAVDLEKHLQTL